MKAVELDRLPKELIKFHNEFPFFSDNLDQAPIKIGTRVRKTNSGKGDTVEDGTLGRVIGSISTPVPFGGRLEYGYTVVWDDTNGTIPIFIAGFKLSTTLS